MSLYDYSVDPPSPDNEYDIEFVCFSGAGVNGVIYAGVMKSLEERGIRQSVKYWVGTSAGAIIAALGALGASSDFIFNFLKKVDFNALIDYGGTPPGNTIWGKIRNYYSGAELFSKLGVARGHRFNDIIRKCISELGYPEDLTYSQLYDRTGNRLVNVTICLNSFSVLHISRSTFPHMAIADGVHASLLIPYVLQPIIMKDPLFDPIEGRMCLDGGILDNNPINACDPQTSSGRLIGINRKAVSFFPMVDGLWGHETTQIDNFMKFSQAIITAMFRHNERIQSHQPYFWQRTVPINTLGHSSLNFSITPEWVDKLTQSGYQAAEGFLQSRKEMIREHGHLPGNLFIPIPIWGSQFEVKPLSNDNLRDTPIYQTNPEVHRERNILGL